MFGVMFRACDMAEDLLIWGATGQARVLHELIGQGQAWRLVALGDRQAVPHPLPAGAVPLLHGEPALLAWLAGRSSLPAAAAAIGSDNRARLAVLAWLQGLGMALPSLVHPRAFVAADALLAEGCQILAQAAVCSHARLGRGVIVNTAAVVEHDCRLGEGAHIAPGAVLAGECELGARVFVGAGAVLLPRLRIGADAVIGAGAVVLHDVPSGARVVGNPARPLPS